MCVGVGVYTFYMTPVPALSLVSSACVAYRVTLKYCKKYTQTKLLDLATFMSAFVLQIRPLVDQRGVCVSGCMWVSVCVRKGVASQCV